MDRRASTYDARRDTGIRWDRWNRKVTMQSLQLMVMNGVVRSAEIDPPRYRAGRPDVKAKTTVPQLSIASVDPAGQGWFSKLFRRRADPLIHHVRHTT